MMMRRYFARDVAFSWPHKGVKNAVACCGNASKAEIKSAASASIEVLQNFNRSHPGATIDMMVEPLDYIKVDGGNKVSKIRFTALKSNVDGSIFQKEPRIGASDSLSITIEVFTRPGLSKSNLGNWCEGTNLRKEEAFFKYVQAGPVDTNPGSRESIPWAVWEIICRYYFYCFLLQ
jgi:hypothetical protein